MTVQPSLVEMHCAIDLSALIASVVRPYKKDYV